MFIGIGNSARGDDAIGWLLADFVREKFPAEWEVEYRYQLQVEDAELISHFDEVIFADATETAYPDGFCFEPCLPAANYFHSSHLQTPEAILYLCREMFNKQPHSHILAVSGTTWELGQALSDQSNIHLRNALHFLIHWMDADMTA